MRENMLPQNDVYKLFFCISIMTDMNKFQGVVSRTGRVPFLNFQHTDWAGLANRIADILVQGKPSIRRFVSVNLFDDSLESATKGLFTEHQSYQYLKELVERAQEGNFKAHDLRDDRWLTTYTASAPPQNFHGVLTVQDDGSADILEETINGMLEHFYAGGKDRLGGVCSLPLLFSGDLHQYSRLSAAMLALFVEEFDHPFENDVSIVVLNQRQQEALLESQGMAISSLMDIF
jgi:hypothetical protein